MVGTQPRQRRAGPSVRVLSACILVLLKVEARQTSLRYDNELSWMRSGWHADKAKLELHDALLTGLAKGVEWDNLAITPSVLGLDPRGTLSAAAHASVRHGLSPAGQAPPVVLAPLHILNAAAACLLYTSPSPRD